MPARKLGRYEILRLLGRGGMSEVYLAYDPRVRREVAIKVLPGHLMEDPSFRDRLEREVQTVARLEHPCIVPVYDYGEEVGQPYVVMRYMPGGSLALRITHGPLTPAELSQMISPLARALDKAHRKNVIHRDIKPGNILFDGEGEAYLADFGIAKAIQSSATMTGSAIIGTPAYMSPEQGSGARNLDGRSDIYSLGVVVFEALTGQQPYQADTPVALVMQHITQEIPSVCATRPDLPVDCEIVIRQAMAKIPDARYAKAGELAIDLARITRGERVLPRPELHTAVTEKLQTPEEEIPKPALKAGGDLDQHLEKLYTDGLSAFYLEDWERACRSFQAIVSMRPDYKNVAAKLADAERQIKLRALYTQAQAAQEAEDWERARAALEEVVAGEPGFKDAAAMLRAVNKRQQLADLYAEARQLHQAHQWQAVLSVFKRIEGLDATYPDPAGLLASARLELDNIERERKLVALYSRGLQHMDAAEWSAALKQFKEIQRVQPGYRDSQALLARAQQELALPGPKRFKPKGAESGTSKKLVNRARSWLQHLSPLVLAGLLALVLLAGIMTVWLGGAFGGLILLQPDYERVIGDIFWAEDHLLATADASLLALNPSAPGLPLELKVMESSISVVSQDARGQLWLGLEGGGLYYQQGEDWVGPVVEGGIGANTVRAIAAGPGGEVWIGTRDGAVYFDGEKWSVPTLPDLLGTSDIRVIAMAPDGVMWFGTWGNGLISRRENEAVISSMSGGNKKWDRISSLQVLGEYLWVGTQAGLVQLDPGGEGPTKYYTRFDGLPADFITALAPDPAGLLWIGTWGGGVSTLDNGQIGSHVFDQKRFNYVVDLAVGGGKVWVKSLGGMMVFDLDTGVWSRYY